ncbi:MAG: porin [Bacteroidota bacterium]
MKKVLIASTALVAATMFSAGAASASEKIKLNLGGFSKWWVVGQWQENKFQNATQSDYNNVDVKGDNEVYFGGSTTLDNGLQVGIDIQLEAGGHTDQTSDTIDESYVFIGGGFGKVLIGSKNNGTYLIHNTAPDAAGNWNEGGILSGGYALVKPTSVSTITPGNGGGNTTAILTDDDSEGLTYVSPTFYGLTFGASYKPNTSQDNRNTTDLHSVVGSNVLGAGVLYANTFGGVGVKADFGAATYQVEAVPANFSGLGNGSAIPSATFGKSKVNEYSTGLNLSYAGFTLGGSYRQVVAAESLNALDGKAWDIGLQYASGPYAVSAAYFNSKVEGFGGNGDDQIDIYQVSGKYTLGAGVDALASVGYAKYQDEAKTASGENKGWVAMTGLSLSF